MRSAAGSALVWGTRGRRFKSAAPTNINVNFIVMKNNELHLKHLKSLMKYISREKRKRLPLYKLNPKEARKAYLDTGHLYLLLLLTFTKY